MASKRKAIRAFFLMLLCVVFTMSFTGAAWSEACSTISAPTSSRIGTRCTDNPACVIVGETHMLEWKSPAPAKIIVVCIHGLGLCARAYQPLAKELSAVGIDGFAVNVRGFGPDREQPDRAKLNCADTVDDVSKLLAQIHKEHPDYRVFLIGESMGGALAIRIAAENPALVDGVVCSAPAWKLLKMRQTAVKGIFELFLFPGTHPGPAARAMMHQATNDSELRDHWLADPSHKMKLSFKEATSFLRFISKTKTYAKQLTKPVLIIQGLNDNLVSPKAVAKLVRGIPSSNKTFVIDAQGEHLVLEEGKFSPPLVEKLVEWIKIDPNNQFSTVFVTVVLNDQTLLPEQERRLKKIRRLGGLAH